MRFCNYRSNSDWHYFPVQPALLQSWLLATSMELHSSALHPQWAQHAKSCKRHSMNYRMHSTKCCCPHSETSTWSCLPAHFWDSGATVQNATVHSIWVAQELGYHSQKAKKLTTQKKKREKKSHKRRPGGINAQASWQHVCLYTMRVLNIEGANIYNASIGTTVTLWWKQ